VKRSVLRAAFALAVALAAVVAPLACTVMNGLHVPPPDASVPPAPEAGPDVADADPCQHARIPEPPTTFTDDPNENQEILVVVRSMDFGVDGGPPPGYDLDNTCTCVSAGESCTSKDKHCDDPNGRDNAMAGFIAKLKNLEGFDGQKDLNDRISSGAEGLLIRVQRYNGQADDSDVFVQLYGSGGTKNKQSDGGFEDVPPTFTKADHWTVDINDLLGPPEALFSRNNATGYVSHGQLVIHIDAHVRLLQGSFTTFKGALVTATVTQTADGPTITDGILAGRWPSSEMLHSLSLAQDPTTGNPFCETPGFADLAKPFVCPGADISVDQAVDLTGAPCDAISLGAAFTAVPASFGDPIDVDPGDARCQDAGQIRCDSP
jgi:hypothetical protein